MLEVVGFEERGAFYCWSLRSGTLRAGHCICSLRRDAAELAIGVDVAFPFDRQDAMGCGAALPGAAFGDAVLLPKAWPRHSIARYMAFAGVEDATTEVGFCGD
jgi:hypothetical protein